MRPKKRSTSPKPSFSRMLAPRPIWVGLLAFLVLVSLACNLPSALGLRPAGSATSATAAATMSLQEALAVPPRDDRPDILKQMGHPDAFRITFEELDSQTVRSDEWSYFDDQTRFDFVDGTLIDTVRLEPAPDGTIFASYYDPLGFKAGMTLDEVQALLAGQQLYQADASDAGLPGGQVVAGNQILMGLDQGQLVYVETLVLTPEKK